jgi:hypothetical protein
LAEAGIEPSVGSVGDSYDNALAETINGLYKAEVIHQRGPWRNFEAVEFSTLEWVDWFNHRRLLEPSETYRQPKLKSGITLCYTKQPWPHNLSEMASGKPGAVHIPFAIMTRVRIQTEAVGICISFTHIPVIKVVVPAHNCSPKTT